MNDSMTPVRRISDIRTPTEPISQVLYTIYVHVLQRLHRLWALLFRV
jgi:hypothetical protein